jgi:predicted RNA-binding Zn-ribbon protein involved in translation (DUF1610 family)
MPDPTSVPSIEELNEDGDEAKHSRQDHPACVTIPKELLDEHSVFQCPECLSTSPSVEIKVRRSTQVPPERSFSLWCDYSTLSIAGPETHAGWGLEQH